MTTHTPPELLEIRRRWLEAARIYYLSPGDDSGMDDATWDHFGRTLYAQRHLFPGCPILQDPEYKGGSLYWVRTDLYGLALRVDPTEARPKAKPYNPFSPFAK